MGNDFYTYKCTWEDLPYYYYGVHKNTGKPYFGSPETNKWVWDTYGKPEVQVLEWFDDFEQAIKVEQRLIKPFYTTDKNCLNESCGRAVSPSGRSKSHETCKNLNIGIHDRKNPIQVEGRRKGHRVSKERKTGIHDKSDPRIMEGCKKGGKTAAAKLNSQKCQCTVTGHISTPGPLSRYQKKRGIDTSNRVYLSKFTP